MPTARLCVKKKNYISPGLRTSAKGGIPRLLARLVLVALSSAETCLRPRAMYYTHCEFFPFNINLARTVFSSAYSPRTRNLSYVYDYLGCSPCTFPCSPKRLLGVEEAFT